MTALTERIGVALGLFFSIILLSCTTLDFETGDDHIPQIEVESSLDTVPINSSYTPDFEISDDVDNPDDLKKEVVIWVENAAGETVDINSFTETAGVYTVFLVVTDSDGNTSDIVEITVIVSDDVEIDEEPPVITLKGDNPMALELDEVYDEPGATAVDNKDGDVTDKLSIDESDVNIHQSGIYKVVYSVSDAAGNEANKVRVVSVGDVDTIPPRIFLLGENPMHLDYKASYEEPGAYALDNESSDTIPLQDFTVTENIDINILGKYKVTYSVSDATGNTATKEREVEVADTITPVVTMNGPAVVDLSVGDTYTEEGATAVDNYDGDITDQLDTTSDVNTSVAGSYTVEYKVTDSNGNTGSATRAVNVGTSGAPVITLLGDNPMDLTVGDTYDEPGATALDQEDGDLTSSIVISGTVNTSAAGTYTVTYTVSDNDGNETTATRTVNVELGDVVIIKASDNNTTVFDVSSGTTFQFNDFNIMLLKMNFSEGTGTYSIDGGGDKEYTSGGMTPTEWPDDGNAVTLIITPTTDTKVKFDW